MKDVGAVLYEARTARGITLEEISARTRIRVDYLKAVEEGAPEKVPGEAYFRAFVRTYAREVGLDPEALLAQYEMAKMPETPAAPAPQRLPERPSLRERRAMKRRRRRLRMLGAVVAVVAAAAAAYWLWANGFFRIS